MKKWNTPVCGYSVELSRQLHEQYKSHMKGNKLAKIDIFGQYMILTLVIYNLFQFFLISLVTNGL